MRIPNESLDDYKIRTRKAADPPRLKQLRLTGEVEVLKPLARWEGPQRQSLGVSPRLVKRRLTGFQRTLAFGGAFAVVAFLITTSLYVGVYGPPADAVYKVSHVVTVPVDQIEEAPAGVEEQTQKPETSGLFQDETSPILIDAPRQTRTIVRQKRPRTRSVFAVNRSRRIATRPLMLMSNFVPTTLVIFIENGEVKTRIEPWLTAGRKKS